MDKKFIERFKDLNSKEISKAIKKSKEKIKSKNVLDLASNFINKAAKISKSEVEFLLKKISSIEKKTNTEIEKLVSVMVEKILENNSNKPISKEIKKEIVKKLSHYNRGKNLFPIIKYVNSLLIKNVPKNINAIKKFKKNIAESLINDAHKTLERKSVA